jgi:hypothetical protein
MESKEARFRVKPDQTCDEAEVKRVVAAAGSYEVTKFQRPTQ